MTTGRENGKSRLVSIRLTFEMIADLKKSADELGQPYQSVMKAAIKHGLPIVRKIGPMEVSIKKETTSYRAPNVTAAVNKLKKARGKNKPIEVKTKSRKRK